jgi:hypothetical protein
VRAANALAEQLAGAARALRAKAEASDAAGKKVLMEAAMALKAHEVGTENGTRNRGTRTAPRQYWTLAAATATAIRTASAALPQRPPFELHMALPQQICCAAAEPRRWDLVMRMAGSAANDATPAPTPMMGAAVATTAVQEAELAALGAAGREGVLKQGYLT